MCYRGLLAGILNQLSMDAVLSKMDEQEQGRPVNQYEFEDEEAEELFNQIQIDQVPLPINQQQSQSRLGLLAPYEEIKLEKLAKSKKRMVLDSDQQQNDEIGNKDEGSPSKLKMPTDKKARKQQKKLRKKMKKQKKRLKMKEKTKHKKDSGLKRLRKEGDDEKESQKWSGESSESLGEDSDASSDSLLVRLNPTKKNNSERKQIKEGFSLKELGNNPEVDYANQQNLSEDSQYKGKQKNNKTKKAKAQKKEVTSNQQLLKSLLNIGLCVDEQNEQDRKEGYSYDNGLEQINNMKGSKKKGLRITNKLFGDVEIGDAEENHEPLPKEIELEVKPRISSGPSAMTCSFLSKAEKLKKARGMESEIQNQQYEKMISSKKKETMAKLISQKQIEEADEIELEVQVPELIKGGSQLNNSIFLKRMSSSMSIKAPKDAPSPKKQLKKLQPQKQKITRLDFFRSISEEVKARSSKEINNEMISKSFKVTKLEEIEELRKKNQEKRKREALMGSEDQSESEEKQEEIVRENKLGFFNKRIQSEEEAEKMPTIQESKKQGQIPSQVNAEADPQPKNFAIEIKKDHLSEDQYRRLLSLQREQSNQLQQESPQAEEEEENPELANEELEQLRDDQNEERVDQMMDQNENQNENENENEKENQLNLEEAQPVELEVDLEVSSLENDSGENQSGEKEQPVNQEYQQYLNELEAEGIQLKKHTKGKRSNRIEKTDLVQTKQNNPLVQNEDILGPSAQTEARREFRKLRKIATIIKNKKKIQERIQKAGQFFEEQAEEGSDNEEHDHEVKKINRDDEQKEYEGLDLDADLQQLIDNAVDIDEQNQELAFRKYMEDVKIQDREQLKKIMRGDFSRNRDHEHMIDQVDEDEKKRIERMEKFEEYLKQKELEEGKELYLEKQGDEENKPEDNSSENYDQGQSRKRRQKENEDMEIEVVDEMNEENLMRYLDEGVVESFRTTTVVKRPISQLPQSYQRSKKTEMRNTMKAKESEGEVFKLKKTSSHLNEMIMKNKEKLKPPTLSFLKKAIPVRK